MIDTYDKLVEIMMPGYFKQLPEDYSMGSIEWNFGVFVEPNEIEVISMELGKDD